MGGGSPKWLKSNIRKRRERERLKVGNNNGQLRIANSPRPAQTSLGPFNIYLFYANIDNWLEHEIKMSGSASIKRDDGMWAAQ